MGLTVKNILDRNLLEGAALVAGEKGAGRQVLWVNFMEILDALDSLQDGELLVTTGFQLDDEERFQDLILRLKTRGVCAVAIQTGYYIHEVPAYILREANRYDFPVIALPAKLTFSQIMHVLLESIGAKAEEQDEREIGALKNRAVRLIGAAAQGREEEKCCLMLAFFSVPGSGTARAGLREEAEKLKTCLASRSAGAEMELQGATALFAFFPKDDFTLGDLTIELIRLVTFFSREDQVNARAGVSGAVKREDAETAFREAAEAAGKLRDIGAKKGVCCYADLQTFEWLDHFSKRDNALSFAYDALKPLIAYDSFHGTEYLQTLRMYLANDCRASETSAKLFIHRHTLNKRIERIAGLCSADFRDCFTRLHFSIALMVYDYFLS